MTEDLPFVDEHRTLIPRPRQRVWDVLDAYAARSLRLSPLLAQALGTNPPQGFARRQVEPPSLLELAGRHRFSTYLLRFELTDEPDGTLLRAGTYAAFPGLRGRAYRALVIGSHGHAWSVRRMLDAVSRGSLDG
jgi:hypothetical protein